MITRIHVLTAACLASSALVFAVPSWGDVTVHEKTVITHDAMSNTLALPAGVDAKDLNSDKAIEKSFKGLTEYAMDKTGFDNIVSYLAEQDSERIKKSTDKGLNNLDGNSNKALTDVIADLEGAWKAKYNSKFTIDAKATYTGDFLQIMTGEVSDPSLLVGNWPVGNAAAGGKMSPTDANEANSKTFGGKVKLEKGRKVAVARIGESHHMPALTASLIHETASGWHFDIPNNINAQMLYDNLVSNLTYMDNHREMWPADGNDANRAMTHAVVAALYNIDLQKLPQDRTAQER